MKKEYFNWHGFVELALAILSDPAPAQAELRTANSRAYYAARGFAAELLLQKHQLQTKNNRVLIEALEKRYPSIGQEMRYLWGNRILADYRQEHPHTRSGAILNLENCKIVIRMLKDEMGK